MIWICTINNHGSYLPVMLIDYGSDEINAFILNVAVSTSIFTEDLIESTNKVLNKLNIFPEFYIQDGNKIYDECVLVIQSCSRILFTTLKACDVHDIELTKYFSSHEIFKESVENVMELNTLIEHNKLVFTPAGRMKNLKFDDEVFSPVLGASLLKEIANNSENFQEFSEMRFYIGTLFDAFKIIWDRKNMQQTDLEQNTREFIEVTHINIFLKLEALQIYKYCRPLQNCHAFENMCQIIQ